MRTYQLTEWASPMETVEASWGKITYQEHLANERRWQARKGIPCEVCLGETDGKHAGEIALFRVAQQKQEA